MKRTMCLLTVFFFLLCNVAKSEDNELLKLGIDFLPPSGWTQTSEIKTQEEITTYSFLYVSPDKQSLIILTSTQMPTTMFNEAIDYWTQQLGAPEEISFLNVPCYVFSFQTNKDMVRKNIQYHFYKNGKAYMINFIENAQTNNQYLSEFKKALNTFNILK